MATFEKQQLMLSENILKKKTSWVENDEWTFSGKHNRTKKRKKQPFIARSHPRHEETLKRLLEGNLLVKRQKFSRSRNIYKIYKTEVCTNLLQEYIHKLKRPAQIRLLRNRSCQDAPRPPFGLKYQLTIRYLSSRI